MDIIPNLSLIFATPNEILDPFNKLVKGRWYKPESGLFVLSKVIVMVEIRDIIIKVLESKEAWMQTNIFLLP